MGTVETPGMAGTNQAKDVVDVANARSSNVVDHQQNFRAVHCHRTANHDSLWVAGPEPGGSRCA
jgi:hypothetical protein